MPPQNADFPHLSRAPITEALIDIQVSLPEATGVTVLQDLHARIREGYPEVKTRHRWESKIEVRPGESPDVSPGETGVDGFMFTSKDRLQVVQFRLDGFTFSRLRPYQDWEMLRDEAKKLWQVYREGVRPEAVRRVAVRYINLIEVPAGEPLETYVVVPPRPPAGFPGMLTGFLQRQSLEDPNRGIAAIVNLFMEVAPSATRIPVWLDVDVFRALGATAAEVELWDILETLAATKNRIFFSSITKNTVESLR